jgi:hypothetical protein
VGWIVVLIIFIIILVIWLTRRKEPAQRSSSSQPTTTEVRRRAVPRHGKTRELLQLGYTRKLRLKIKYETGNPLPGEPAIKVRDIDIYGLGSEYFDAYCHYRSAQRTFKIVRVLWARLSDETYQIPPDYVPSGWVTEGWGEMKDESVEVAPPNVPTSLTPKDIEIGYKQEEWQRASREAATYGRGSEVTRTYARHDWQKLFEESIKTPFPDEWSSALPYLHEAYKLEREGADQQKVQEVLEKARQADSNATSFYMGRRSIMEKMQKHDHELE